MVRDGDTQIGGDDRQFPPTELLWSKILCARDPNSPGYAHAVSELCRLYWKPAYAYIRAVRGYANEPAKDLTQEFFAEVIDGGMLSRFKPERGSFRAYLRGALHLFLAEQHRKASALKRGGGRRPLSLDETEFEFADADPTATPDEAFERQWERSLLDLALGDLRSELTTLGRDAQFRIFERYELFTPSDGPPTYADLAREFGVKASDVDNWLRDCRRRLRELAVRRIREYVESDDEAARELGTLFA